MANVTPWLLFGFAQDVGGGFGQPWTAIGNAITPDGLEATSGPIGFVLVETKTSLLRVSQPALGGQLPQGFRLRGVELEVKGRWTGALDGTRTVPIDAVVGSSVRSALGSCSLPVNLAGTCVKGGPTDTLGFAPWDVLNPGFGFQLYGKSTSMSIAGNTLRVDSLRVRIHWDDPPVLVARSRSRLRSVLARAHVL